MQKDINFTSSSCCSRLISAAGGARTCVDASNYKAKQAYQLGDSLSAKKGVRKICKNNANTISFFNININTNTNINIDVHTHTNINIILNTHTNININLNTNTNTNINNDINTH